MKKTLSALVAIVSLLPFLANAQWTQQGTTGNYYLTSGNAGIGLTGPSTKLEVSGAVTSGIQANSTNAFQLVSANWYYGVSGTSYIGQFRYYTSPNNSLYKDNALYQLRSWDAGTNTENSIITYKGNGNVGIGTDNPTGKLDVNFSNTEAKSLSVFSTATNPISSPSGGLRFAWYGTNFAEIQMVRQSGASDGLGLSFHTSTSNSSSTIERMRIDANGNVGIGTSSIASKLSVAGGDILLDNGRWYNSKTSSGTLTPLMGIGGDNNLYLGDLFANTPSSLLLFRTNGTNQMSITPSGDVGIGITYPDAKLAVNGTIHTQEVKVDMTGWNDFVFKPTYHLPPLSQVKTYIDQYQHLPEIPSEAEIIKNGVNLGEMNKLLVKKVEELTLYLIEQNKQLQEQRQITDRQNKTNQSLQEQLDQLKKQLDLLTRKQ